MPYIGKEPKSITTISDLTATGTTALTGNATAAGTLDVTGAITSSAGATITTADNTAQLTLTSTDADANAGPVLDLVRDSGSPADSDNTGAIVFKADDDGGNSTEFAKIESSIIDASNTTEDGRLIVRTITAGTATSRLDFTNTETVFNDSSIDVDFRVESDGNANMLFVDASADAVGVGTNSPTLDSSLAGLSVSSDSTLLHINDSDGACLKLSDPASGSNRGLGIALQGTSAAISNCESGELRFGTGNSERGRFDASGTFMVGKTTAGFANDGFQVTSAGQHCATRNDATPFFVNRRTGGGAAIELRFDNTKKGDIVVASAGTTYNTTSDIRLKQDIEPLQATDKLMAMNPVSYTWKAEPDGPRSMGFIAQEMQEVMPEAVSADDSEEKMLSMDYGRITPVLVSALQDAHKKIEELENRIAAMESK